MGKQVTEPLGAVKSGFVRVKEAVEGMTQGRKRSIPERVWGDAFRLYSEGHGNRMLASRLADLGVWTTRGSVERLIKGLPPYNGTDKSGEKPHRIPLKMGIWTQYLD